MLIDETDRLLDDDGGDEFEFISDTTLSLI